MNWSPVHNEPLADTADAVAHFDEWGYNVRPWDGSHATMISEYVTTGEKPTCAQQLS